MIYVPHYTPYISSSKTNTTIQAKEFTEEEIHITEMFMIIFSVILILLIICMIKDIIKYFK